MIPPVNIRSDLFHGAPGAIERKILPLVSTAGKDSKKILRANLKL